MLSPGKHYQQVPKDRDANLRFRMALLDEVRSGGPLAQRAIRQMCGEDILFYINAFGNQYNPDKLGQPGETGPFLTYDFQDEALQKILWCVENRKDLSIEKSRFMGASWLCLWAMEWLWHWRPFIKLLCVSKDADSVDKRGDPDSLFWKIDFIHEYQPDWLMPKKWNYRKCRKKMVFRNPETRSTITGTASTSKSGVGGRATVMFVDEFSQIDDDYELFNRTSNTTSCRIFNGTHLDPSTCFYELNDPNSLVGSYIQKLQMHWTQHPDWNSGMYYYDPAQERIVVLDKQYRYPPDFQFVTTGLPLGGPKPGVRSPRYDHEVKRKTSQRAVAMDIDIDPHGASSQFFEPVLIFDRIRHDARRPQLVGELLHADDGSPRRFTKATSFGRQKTDTDHLEVWCELDENDRPYPSKYVIGCDPSHGTGATPTCVTVLDARTGEKVAQYTNAHISTAEFPAYLVALGKWFADEGGNGAYIAWEATGPGIMVGNAILDLRYRNIYWDTDPLKKKAKKSDKPGWHVNPKKKLLLIEEYKAALKTGAFHNPSEEALKECLKFIFSKKGVRHGGDEGDDPAAARENHGDHVIADALAYMLAKQLGFGGTPIQEEKKQKPKIGSFEWRQMRVQEEESQQQRWGRPMIGSI